MALVRARDRVRARPAPLLHPAHGRALRPDTPRRALPRLPRSGSCNFRIDLRRPSLKALYLDHEEHDGYFRDRCVQLPANKGAKKTHDKHAVNMASLEGLGAPLLIFLLRHPSAVAIVVPRMARLVCRL